MTSDDLETVVAESTGDCTKEVGVVTGSLFLAHGIFALKMAVVLQFKCAAKNGHSGRAFCLQLMKVYCCCRTRCCNTRQHRNRPQAAKRTLMNQGWQHLLCALPSIQRDTNVCGNCTKVVLLRFFPRFVSLTLPATALLLMSGTAGPDGDLSETSRTGYICKKGQDMSITKDRYLLALELLNTLGIMKKTNRYPPAKPVVLQKA